MKKHHQDIRDLIYVHLNQTDQSVMSYGIEFTEFVDAFSGSLNHLLLLKHRYDDSEFNGHTLLEYVPKDKINGLSAENVYDYGDFCWIDFAEIEGVNELSGSEIAELLYLGHLKQHLKTPFYNKLDNRFVYLAHDDGWFNKTYYRSMKDLYDLLSIVLSGKLSELKLEKSLFGIKKKRNYPPVNKELLLSLTPLMKEGICFSLKDAEQQRGKTEIPIWVMGDFDTMDDMNEEYEQMDKSSCHAKLVFDKKTKEWKLLVP